MSQRGISTVLDVALCLLLVSASALTVAQTPTERPHEVTTSAGAVASTLATATARVNYSLTPDAVATDERTRLPTDDEAFERSARGTLAGLLAEAAVANVTVRGEKLTRSDQEFQRSVAEAVRRTTDRRTGRVHVVALWQPHPGSHAVGRVSVGERPPPTADVHAATLSVPSGTSSVRSEARARARTSGFSGVANAYARRVVNGLFPPADARLALQSEYPVSAVARSEYRRAFSRYDTAPPTGLPPDAVDETNRRLASAMAPAVEADLRRRFDSPSAAANASAAGRVRIVVRVWSP